MRNVAAVVLASAMGFSAYSALAEVPQAEMGQPHQNGGLATGSMTQNPQSHMFDGIRLSEHQRQQLRDLMQQARHTMPPASVDEYEKMHDLVTAEKFNEAAVREQAAKYVGQQIERQVALSRVRNQMYQLLTPEQKATLRKNYQQRIQQMRALANLQLEAPQHPAADDE